jgi:hypothetical protein
LSSNSPLGTPPSKSSEYLHPDHPSERLFTIGSESSPNDFGMSPSISRVYRSKSLTSNASDRRKLRSKLSNKMHRIKLASRNLGSPSSKLRASLISGTSSPDQLFRYQSGVIEKRLDAHPNGEGFTSMHNDCPNYDGEESESQHRLEHKQSGHNEDSLATMTPTRPSRYSRHNDLTESPSKGSCSDDSTPPNSSRYNLSNLLPDVFVPLSHYVINATECFLQSNLVDAIALSYDADNEVNFRCKIYQMLPLYCTTDSSNRIYV